MKKPIVVVVTDDPRWQRKLEHTLEDFSPLYFARAIQEAKPLIKTQLIGCVIIPVYITIKEDLSAIKRVKNYFGHVPIIIYGRLADTKLSLELGKIGVDAFIVADDEDELIEKVLAIITQRTFKVDFKQFGITIEKCPLTIKKALTIIEADFLNIKYVSELANHLKISTSYFQHQFKKYCGLSCKRLLSALKLHYISYLKEKTKLSFKSIIYEYGFIERHVFYRLFRNITGMTFSSYERNYSSHDFPQIVLKHCGSKK